LIDAFPPTPVPAPQTLQVQQNPAAAPGIALSLPVLERYVGEWATPGGMTVAFRRDGDRLLVKPGNRRRPF
jgi:hypothetical protein